MTADKSGEGSRGKVIPQLFKSKNSPYRRFGKRLFDLTLAVPGYLVLSSVMGVIALLVRLKLGCPVLFRQERPGLHGMPFTIYKFRTMTDAINPDGKLLPDAERLTRLGRFLRSTSLDELPELWNVLKGDMSIVGPRPLLMQYLERYTPVQARRHEVKPGITGWAQVNGRNNTPFSKRFAMDVWYVDNCSFQLDLKIIILTVIKVLRQEDVRSDLDQCYYEVDDCGLSNDRNK
ncbi:MAG: sugar transferase [Desulfobacterales bacterium]|nr:sugar transferase [Desulfobacterales bacterium]